MNLFGVDILESPREKILDTIVNRIDNNQKTFIVTANALIMLRASKDINYRTILKNADFVIPDGFGIHLIGMIKHRRKIPRYPGIDLVNDLIEIGSEKPWKFYLLGSREEIVKTVWNLYKDKINIVGYHHGYFNGDGPVEDIISLEPDVVFVAMGAPKQEVWIWKNIDKFKKGLFVGVGGSFDVLSGYKKRAPQWMRKMGLEWAYRFLQSPLEKWNVPFKIVEFLIKAISDKGEAKIDEKK